MHPVPYIMRLEFQGTSKLKIGWTYKHEFPPKKLTSDNHTLDYPKKYFKLSDYSKSQFSNKAAVSFGVLGVTQIENDPFNGSLSIIEGKLYLGDRLTVFDYHQEGYFEKFSAGEYLSIDESGKLTMRSHPHLGFKVENSTDSWVEGAFTYDGESCFQLCGDNSIGFKSNCTGAFRIAIAYTEIR